MIFSYFSPFGMIYEMSKLMLQTNKMLLSSGEVIFHRVNMMNQAMCGTRAWSDPEFTKLWQEKATASMEAYSSMSKSMMLQPFSPARSMEQQMTDGIKAIAASTRPYSTKANANAVRLRKKKH
jgi:predicted phosphohydrolase